MIFIGQPHIMRELGVILPLAYQGKNYNILLKAQSGYGKTKMALDMCNYVTNNFTMIIEKDGNVIYDRILDKGKRVVFVDEVHLVKDIEILYRLMDLNKYFFVFATNIGLLPEAFENRCIVLTFEPYSQPELEEITMSFLPILRKNDISLTRMIINSGEKNPRIIKRNCQRLDNIFTTSPLTEQSLKDALVNIMNIQDGLDIRMRMYLEVLGKLNTASLYTLSSVLGMSQDVIRAEIEPHLLYRGLIGITSKGRNIR